MSWLPPPLETPRLTLRSLAAAPGEAAASVERPDDLPGLPSNWSLLDRESGAVIGTIGFIRWERESRSAELGFMLAPSRRRSGLMTEAIQAVRAFGFDALKLSEIVALVQPSNIPAIRLLEKAGFIPAETVRKRLHSEGEPEALVVFRLVAP